MAWGGEGVSSFLHAPPLLDVAPHLTLDGTPLQVLAPPLLLDATSHHILEITLHSCATYGGKLE